MKPQHYRGLAVSLLAFVMAGCTGSPTMRMDPDHAIVDARDTLRQAAEDKDPVIQSNAIEALSQTVGRQEGGLYVQALNSPNPVVQFAAAMAIGDLKYEPAKELLGKIADAEGPDKRVYAGALYALHRMGDYRHSQDLARLIQHHEAEVRALTALVLGKLGEPSAAYLLKGRVGDEREARVEIQLVESLAMLGDPYYKAILEGYCRRPFLDDRLVAIPAVARVRADHAVVVLTDLAGPRNVVPVRVAAAGAMAQLGLYSDENYNLCLQAVENPLSLTRTSFLSGRKEISTGEILLVQRLAAIALGSMNRPAAVDMLHRLLRHQDGSIRVAAAQSILRLLAPYTAVKPKPPAASPEQPSEVPAPATGPAAIAPLPATEPASAPATSTVPASEPASAPAAQPPAVPTTAEIPSVAPKSNGASRPSLETSGPRD